MDGSIEPQPAGPEDPPQPVPEHADRRERRQRDRHIELPTVSADGRGQVRKVRTFFVRLNNGARAIEDPRERERFIAQRWGQ